MEEKQGRLKQEFCGFSNYLFLSEAVSSSVSILQFFFALCLYSLCWCCRDLLHLWQKWSWRCAYSSPCSGFPDAVCSGTAAPSLYFPWPPLTCQALNVKYPDSKHPALPLTSFVTVRTSRRLCVSQKWLPKPLIFTKVQCVLRGKLGRESSMQGLHI